MNRSTILSVALSVILIVCLIFVLRSCFAVRSTLELTPQPVPSYAPVRTPAPMPTVEPTPEPAPEPTPTPEPLPFAREHGFVFDAPEEQNIPAVQAASLPEAVCRPVWAKVSAPRIKRSEPDEEGLVTWEIRYSTTVDTGFSMPADATCKDFCVLMNGYDLFDYDSGRMLNSRAGLDLRDEQSSSRTTTLPNESGAITVSVTENRRCTWDKWKLTENEGRANATSHAKVETVLTVRAPADYHGLILGLDRVNALDVPANLFSAQPGSGELTEYWEGNTADWVFLLAENCVEAVPAQEAAPAA